MLTQITGTGSYVLKVEDFSKGLIFKNVRRDSTIKVDFVSKNGIDRNVFPKLRFDEYAQLFTSLTPRDMILNHDGTAYTKIAFMFSLAGSLELTEDDYYQVTLENLNNRSIEVHNIDDLFISPLDRAIQVDRYDIKASLDEKQVDTMNYAMAFFPNEQPSKIETHVGGRKVTYGIEQIKMFNEENRLTEVNTGEAPHTYINGTLMPSYPVLQTEQITIHKKATEMIFFLVSA